MVVFSGKFWEIFQSSYIAEHVNNVLSKRFEKIVRVRR